MRMKSIIDFLAENTDTVFRYVTYNKFNIWTPEQKKECYVDESVYLDTHYTFAKILNIYDTPNGAMIEFDVVDDCEDYHSIGRREYKLLNDIELTQFKIDNEEQYEE